MFEDLPAREPDGILVLARMHREDPRADKIDLGVGVYRDASGNTPVMRAVKEAERRVWETQDTKGYVGLAGATEFNEAMIGLVLGGAAPRGAVSAAATPGGTGAVRQALELARMAVPGGRVFVPSPTWPNHLSILDHLGTERVAYRYFDDATREVDLDGLVEDLGRAREGDLVLLHGCCHNPTGADMTGPQWDAVVEVLRDTGATPMIDIAYQGLGLGLEEDAEATRKVAASVPECLVAASCSKNFGIYRERAGILMLAPRSADRAAAQGALEFLNRQNFSFPPDHGARLVATILNDDALRADWKAELEDMRKGALDLRERLAGELRRRSGSGRFDFLARHRGMFSRLGAAPGLVEKMREESGVYMVGDGRMNIAGLSARTVPVPAEAIIRAGI